MELPDCPPGAEGYEDSVTEVPKKPDLDDSTCTKAELEFQEHLNSLKLKLEDGSLRCMVERRGRDVSSNWIYLCYPCAAVCSGESILQMHISGKKHKSKLSLRKVWPASIFETHPYILREKGVIKTGATEKINQKMAEEVIFHKNSTEFDQKYNKYRDEVCHIQETLDNVKAPLLGIEYLIEHPPEKEHYEPSYLCTLCSKQGYPRTIVNHLTCFWHRSNYVARHFPKADMKIIPHRRKAKFREGVQTIMNRLAQRIDDKYGRLKPVNIDKEEFEKNKEHILQWIFKGFHISEDLGLTFEEVVDEELINSLSVSDSDSKVDKRNPSPPVVPAPTKPQASNIRASARLRRRQDSTESLSDVSDEDIRLNDFHRENDRATYRDRPETSCKLYELYQDKHAKPFRTRYAIRNGPEKTDNKPPNYGYKMKLIEEKKGLAIEAARKTLAYHEKNPEKHPLYPEEWKKFWNKRYKEIQAEGKDPSKHDFKPEWISFWMGRMKELHDEELRVNVSELYRKMGVSPPELESYDDKISDGGGNGNRRSPNLRSSRSPIRRRSPDPRRRSPDPRRRSPDSKTSPDSRRRSPDIRRRSPDTRTRSPDHRRRSPDLRRRSPDSRRRSPDSRRRSPDSRRRSPDFRRRTPDSRRRSPDSRRRSPDPRKRSPDYRGRSPLSGRHSPDLHRHQSPHNRKSPFARRRSPDYRKPSVNYRQSRRSPVPRRRTPEHRSSPLRSRSPLHKNTSGDGDRRADNPLSQRMVHRSLSPRSYHAHPTPSMQTVLISDDELNPDDGLSPWNSDNDIDSVGSIKELRSRGGSVASRNSRSRLAPPAPHGIRPIHLAHTAYPQDFGPTDNVVATLRLLVALEDYLGSLGPKIVDLLTEALKMEKEKANSSEELLDRETVVALLETAKEKLKGAMQAGLVTGSAAVAVRASIVRVAAALHEADTRHKGRIQSASEARMEAAPVSVAGVGAVDRAEIAAQMAAALVAEGRTDVSPEELAQLVEAVVGMAEAKKREVQAKKQALTLNSNSATSKTSTYTASATTALQMLQSAYDDRNGPTQREDTSDAMDGLSDSDLETLLKNFNELSAEEQHSLIAYLKKLEVREPLRVEKLRQFVSAAAANASLLPSAARPADLQPVAIESDDDDYTVEEVFKSATQKVKENQIQQEMEIVKKSLEETKTAATEPMEIQSDLNVANKVIQSSAADLLALVQASIQSSSQSTPASAHHAVDVVASSNQLRSFGDIPEMPMINAECNIMPNPALTEMTMYLNRQSPNSLQGSALHSPQNRMQFGGVSNSTSESYISSPNIRPTGNNRPPPMSDRQNLIINNRPQYMGDSMQASMSDGRHHLIQDTNRQPLLMQPRMGERQPVMHDNRQPLVPDNRQPLIPENRQPLIPDNRQPLIPDNRQPLIPDNRQPLIPDNRQPLIPDNRQPLVPDNRQPLIPDNRQPLISDNRQPLIPDNRPPLIPDNRQPLLDRRQPLTGDSRQSLQGDRLASLANDKQPLIMDNTQSLRQPALGVNHEQNFMADSREQMQPGYDNYNQDYSYDSGGWNNYRNGPMQNNYSHRPDMNQQNYNNYNKNPNMNFRGRGRGFTAARGRGRGRN